MVLTREERENLLENVWNVPRSEICTAVRSTLRLKNQRRTTVTNLSASTKFEEVLESAGRKCKRVISFQRRPSVKAAQLTKEHLAAEAQRKAIWEKLIESSDHLGEAANGIQKRSAAQERSVDSSIHSAPAAFRSSRQTTHPTDQQIAEQESTRFGDRTEMAKGTLTPILAREDDAPILDKEFEPSWNPDATHIRHSERGRENVNGTGKVTDAGENLNQKKTKKKGKKGKKRRKKKRSASPS